MNKPAPIMVLRDYGSADASGIPTLIHALYAGHSAMIADYADGQSLVQTLRASGLERVALTDVWPTRAHWIKAGTLSGGG